MIQDISEKINCLKKNSKIFKKIFRGIERETLRIDVHGNFSLLKHPYSIGSSLTHKWITTDFSENFLEFITPPSNDINYLLSFLKNLHSFVASKIKNERMWPFSIPYCYNNQTKINVADYGSSNIGKIKTIYRHGLKHRYGSLSNTISGIHYNFSLPPDFWKYTKKKISTQNNQDYISSGYLNLIRNYYKFGWIVPYLFGASPAISEEFFNQEKKIKYPFKKNKENILYFPWATSLRLSNFGHTKIKITDLNITFNNLKSYTSSLQNAIHTSNKRFLKIGLKDTFGRLKQLNTNMLQMENELYVQIRPKRNTHSGESLINALNSRGIEYVEIRSLDINPFSPIGIDKTQILFLDLFLIWCALVDAPNLNKKDFVLINNNWEKIIFEGRKPNQKIYIDQKKEKKTIIEIFHLILKNIHQIALILDCNEKNCIYEEAYEKIMVLFENPELTYSAKFLKNFIKTGLKKTGLNLSNKYHEDLLNTQISTVYKKILEQEVIESHKKQIKIEKEDTLSLSQFLKKYYSYSQLK